MKENPDPKPNSYDSLSICHWNLNRFSAHHLSLLRSYISISLFTNMILHASQKLTNTQVFHDNLELPGYNLVRADNPTNTKRGDVCIYYHNSLPVKVLDIQFLNECLNFEIRIGGKCVALFVYIDHLVQLEI